MNKLIISQTGGYENKNNYPVESVSYSVVEKLYNIGKADDDPATRTLTNGVDTSISSRPIISIRGSIETAYAFVNQLEYFLTKYPNLKISVNTTYIYFEDSAVQTCLIAGGIGDGIGITVQDANSAVLTRSMFENNTDITSFNEFRRFTNANNSVPVYLFNGCTNLQRIDLSECRRINEHAFQNTAISGELSLPNVTYIGAYAFRGTGITSVKNLGQITDLSATDGTHKFVECSNLTEFIYPVTLKKFSFVGVYGNPGNKLWVENHILPYGLLEISTMPKNKQSGCVKYIQIPSTVTKINCVEMNYYKNAFVGMYIVVQATTPPNTGYTDNGNSFNSKTYLGHPEYSKWYVPDAQLTTYLANADWAAFASSIFPISLLETDSPTYWAIYLANKDYGIPTSNS